MPRKPKPLDPGPESTYSPDWLICQSCGRGAAPDDPDVVHWLVSPDRTEPDLYIIRCPEHISRWALRISKAGQTQDNLEKMRWGNEVWPALKPRVRPGVDPIPAEFIGADGRNINKEHSK